MSAFRKLIYCSLLFFLIAPFPGTANSQIFSDVSRSHWAHDSITWAVEQRIVTGYPDGTFKPENPVREAEFLAMLFRAFPEISIPPAGQGESWDEPYFSLATSMQWPVWRDRSEAGFNRGRMAQVVAASQGYLLPQEEAVQYLLDHQLANGKTSATVEGFGMGDVLRRSEAVKLILNLKGAGVTLSEAVLGEKDRGDEERGDKNRQEDRIHVRGIGIGDSEADVIAKLGQPVRKDESEYGFDWYIYNQDYSNYVQIGLHDGKVVGLYTNGSDWSVGANDITRGSRKSDLRSTFGEELSAILKDHTYFNFNDKQRSESPAYLIEQSYVTFFLDIHEQDAVIAIQVIEKETELGKKSFHGDASDALRDSFERQMLDLVNAARVSHELDVLSWDQRAAAAARKHSADMASRDYFAHQSPEGTSPFDRMKAEGIVYSIAAENLAAGNTSAIFAHHSLMNSPGHRTNILLEDVTHLGVGVSLGEGSYTTYFTQKFFAPMPHSK